MKTFVVLTVLALLTGCSVTAKVNAYQPIVDTRKVFEGDGAIIKVELSAERQWTNRFSGNCSYMHVSNLMSGPPFNDKSEAWIDAVGCGVTVKVFGGK